MAYKGPGKIVGLVAIAGLIAILATVVYSRLNPSTEIPDPRYDLVFKYCTQVYVPNEAELAATRETSRFQAIAALQPGTYRAGGGGYLFIFGGGMFLIALPSQLQMVRNFGGTMKADSTSDRPRNIIGCRPEQLARALEVYGMDVGPFLSGAIKGAPPAASIGKTQ